jgi:hypothetical protein
MQLSAAGAVADVLTPMPLPLPRRYVSEQRGGD